MQSFAHELILINLFALLDGHSTQMVLDIGEFKFLEELTISENRTLGTASFALINWDLSFKQASESLKKLSIKKC